MGDFIDIFFIKFELNAPMGYYDENALTQNPKKEEESVEPTPNHNSKVLNNLNNKRKN
jgi:hypothetical protein